MKKAVGSLWPCGSFWHKSIQGWKWEGGLCMWIVQLSRVHDVAALGRGLVPGAKRILCPESNQTHTASLSFLFPHPLQKPPGPNIDLSLSQRWTRKAGSDGWLLCFIQGAGTLDGTLIRNIVSRSEIDLNLIKNQFKKMYGKTLSSMIMVSHELPILTPVWNRDLAGKPECCDQCHQSHVSIPSQGVSHLHSLLCGTHRDHKEAGVTSGGPCSPRKLALPLCYGYPFENDTLNPCRMNHIWRVNESSLVGIEE